MIIIYLFISVIFPLSHVIGFAVFFRRIAAKQGKLIFALSWFSRLVWSQVCIIVDFVLHENPSIIWPWFYLLTSKLCTSWTDFTSQLKWMAKGLIFQSLSNQIGMKIHLYVQQSYSRKLLPYTMYGSWCLGQYVEL